MKAVLMVQLVGWLGSALLVLSLMQSRALRLRILNLIAAAVLLVYNAGIGAVPQIALNAILAVINLWKIVELRRTPVDVDGPAQEHSMRMVSAERTQDAD